MENITLTINCGTNRDKNDKLTPLIVNLRFLISLNLLSGLRLVLDKEKIKDFQ